MVGLLNIIRDCRFLGADRPTAWRLTYEAAVKLPATAKAEVLCGLAQQLDACSAGREYRAKWKQPYASARDLPAPAGMRVLQALVDSSRCITWSEAADSASDRGEPVRRPIPRFRSALQIRASELRFRQRLDRRRTVDNGVANAAGLREDMLREEMCRGDLGLVEGRIRFP